MLVEMETRESVRILRMNHGKDNRFSGPFVAALLEALVAAEKERSVRAIVFTGAQEKYFCNGLDLAWLIQQPREAWGPFLREYARLLFRTFTFPKPVIAALNGHAFAGGLFLALAMDWRVMREDRGWLCIPEIDLGLDLPPGHVALLGHVIGMRNAERLAFWGERLGPEEAQKLGLVDELAPAEEVLVRAVKTARTLAGKNPGQFAAHKRNLRTGPGRMLELADPPYILSLIQEKQGV